MPPVRPFANIGAGMADLVLLPLEQLKRDGRVLFGLRRGAASFAHAVTVETLDVGSRLASAAQVSSQPSGTSSAACVHTHKPVRLATGNLGGGKRHCGRRSPRRQ